MLPADWAAYVHTALDPLCNTTVTFVGGIVWVDSATFAEDALAHYEGPRVEIDQQMADECIASIKADLGL